LNALRRAIECGSGSWRRPVREELDVHIDINVLTLQPLIALIFGILILIMPRILNYLIAIYLILVGLVGLWPHLFSHLSRVG